MFLLCTGETTAVRQEIPNCVLVFVIAMTSYSCETGWSFFSCSNGDIPKDSGSEGYHFLCVHLKVFQFCGVKTGMFQPLV